MSIRINITLYLLIVSGCAFVAALILYYSWKSHETTVMRIEVISKQLDLYSSLLLQMQHLEGDVINMLRLSKFDKVRIDKVHMMITQDLKLAEKLISKELKGLDDDPELEIEKDEVDTIKNLQLLHINIKNLLHKFAMAIENKQLLEAQSLVSYFRTNLLARFSESLQRGLLDEKSELIAKNRKLSKNSLYYQISGLILGILLISYISGYNIYYANRNITREHLIQKNELEKIVKQRTLKLTEVNKKLKQVDIMRGQFLADISHEIKTPITAIRGEAEIRLRKAGYTEPEYRETLTRVKLLSDQVGALIDDLLFVARAEKDAIHFEFKKNEIDGIIVSVVNSYRVIAQQKDIDIEIEWPDVSVELFMDIFRIKQAMNIILDNALKFSIQGNKIIISISVDQSYLNIAVKNRGVSVAEEEIPFLFERFYRGNNNTEQNGSGLGLPIAKWIIDRHKGQIDLHSNENGETVVTMRLPVKNPELIHH